MKTALNTIHRPLVSLIILSVIFALFAANRKRDIKQRLETLVETIQLQREWHGLNLDSYSLGIIINSFLNKNTDITPTQISIKDNYLKQYNLSDLNFLNQLLPFNFSIQSMQIQTFVTARQLSLWLLYSVILCALFFYLLNLGKKIIENNQRLAIAKRVNHDIKAPINALQTLLKGSYELSGEQVLLIKESILRINDISLDLNLSPNSRNNEYISLNEMISIIERSFGIQNKKVKISMANVINPHLDRELIRHLSNIINNAFEASSRENPVFFEISQASDFLKISIKDNGTGIPDHILKKINKGKSATYGKSNGQGIGLSSAKKYVESLGGYIAIDSQKDIGSTVSLFIPNNINKTFVHLDDDYFIRKAWQIDAEKSGVKLLSFEAFSELQEQLSSIPLDSHFYIDKNLLGEIDGIEISKHLNKNGFKNLYLSTGETVNITDYPFILGLNNKTSPF